MDLRILTWNTLFAGRDGSDVRRANSQISVINSLRPDVFLMQEVKGFEIGGCTALYALEAAIEMRGFLAIAPRTGQNVAIFIRAPLVALAFESDGANFHHALATLKVSAPGLSRPLTFMSAHLCPNGTAVRRREAFYLATHAATDAYVLLTGDFNSASPHDAEPKDFASLPMHHRTRYLADDLETIDRSVVASLEAAGWVDIGHALGGSDVPTVPCAAFKDTEFATMRCDYVMASKALAQSAASYSVVRNPATDAASDHYPVLATFDGVA